MTPIDLAATATLSTYLAINPNLEGNEAFISPSITVANNCNAPIVAYAVSLKSVGESPKVTAADAKEWSKLSSAQSREFIALGLSGGDIENILWFTDEDAQEPVRIASLPVGSDEKFTFHGNFGRAIDQAQSYEYEMVLKLALKD